MKFKMNNGEIIKLLNKYTDIIEKLRGAGVIRTGKVVADYGEYVASKRLDLKLVGSPVNKGYDAIDRNGKKYEIKTRKAVTWNSPNIFPINPKQLRVIDFLIYVEFDNNWNLVKLLKIPTGAIKANKHNRVCVSKDLIKKFNILKKIN